MNTHTGATAFSGNTILKEHIFSPLETVLILVVSDIFAQ